MFLKKSLKSKNQIEKEEIIQSDPKPRVQDYSYIYKEKLEFFQNKILPGNSVYIIY